MAQAMPGVLLRAWVAYAEVEPFGEDRGDLRIAQLAALLGNCHRDPKRTRAFKTKDFMFDFDRHHRVGKRTPAEVWSDLKSRVLGFKEAVTGNRKQGKGK